MGWPVVTVSSGGLPVTDVGASGIGMPIDEATNGFGVAITYVASGGLPVTGGTGVIGSLRAAITGTINFVAGLNQTNLIGGAISGTINVATDIGSGVVPWDYDREYLLNF